jgi:Uri superfamily endonuclease
MIYYIYAYETPIDITLESKGWKIPAGSYFYIGKGKGKRMYDHLNENDQRENNNIKKGIIKKIKQSGYAPNIVILNKSENELKMFEQEIYYIKEFGRLVDGNGYLSNLTLGGQGMSGYRHKEETKQRWSQIRKGISPGNKGQKRPGIGGRPKGKKWSEDERAKQDIVRSQPNYYDYLKTEEHRAKMSRIRKGCKGSAKGKKWYNDGCIETYAFDRPPGFEVGRLKRQTNGKKGLCWYTNGTVNKQYKQDQQPEGWFRGRTLRK